MITVLNVLRRMGLVGSSSVPARAATPRRASSTHHLYIGMAHATYKRASSVVLLALSLVLIGTPAAAFARAGDKVDGRSPSALGVSSETMPDVTMAAGELVAADGRVLWSRKADTRRAMASLTKIMTAVVAMENSTPNELVKVPAEASRVGESTSFLVPGDTIEMDELLEGLLVKSGNDSAVTIADHVAGNETAFVAMMNKRAKELGLTHTHFANAHGLDAPGHYTTANDLGTLARFAMTKPEFRRIVGERTAVVRSKQHSHKVESTNLMIHAYNGATGVKTGYTSDAGRCLVASATRNGIELYAVVLGTRSEIRRFAEARDLLDWGFAHYRPQSLASKGTVLGESVVLDYLDQTVNGQVSQDATLAVFDLAGPMERRVSMAEQKAPVKRGQRIGVATFTQAGDVVATVPLRATIDVKRPNIFARAWIGTVRVWRRIFGGQLHAAAAAVTNMRSAASQQEMGAHRA
ncbi:MAG TPA: D-alanyl-D-alanine carboxypeptidase family protein [Coriobacteriia bacterium]|nr:D-alanyl-D-alanine carboxypeptidase family protein [Coriobacteriia bacterium]